MDYIFYILKTVWWDVSIDEILLWLVQYAFFCTNCKKVLIISFIRQIFTKMPILQIGIVHDISNYYSIVIK